MSDYYNYHASEISEKELEQKFEGEKVLAFDYDCYLLERKTPKGYVYTALNRSTGRSFKLFSLKELAMADEIAVMMKTISISDIAGPGRMQADRHIDDEIGKEKAAEILLYMLDTVIPKYNYIISDELKERASNILKAITNRNTLPVNADSSDIEIICCLIAAIIVKRGRMNDYYARRMYPLMQYGDMTRMPIVFSVPSIDLQRRVMKELLPKTSEMLIKAGVIRDALSYVERKGRGNYLCRVKAKTYLTFMKHRSKKTRLGKQLKNDDLIDLEELGWLTQKDKDSLSVDENCSNACPQYKTCKYVAFLERARSYSFDIQVCTHRYHIADVFNRRNVKKGYKPLIPNYQALIICDTDSYIQTVEEMYGAELSGIEVKKMCDSISKMSFRRSGLKSFAKKDARKLHNENTRLFKSLSAVSEGNNNSVISKLDAVTMKHLLNITNIAERLIYTLQEEAFYAKAEEVLDWVHRRFGADVTSIKLNTLLADLEFMKVDFPGRVVAIFKAICNLSEIQEYVSNERFHRSKRRYDNSDARNSYLRYIHRTENEAIANLDSLIRDMIEEKTSCLLKRDMPVGNRSERILRLIKRMKHFIAQVQVITELEGYKYQVETDCCSYKLCAKPRDIAINILSNQQGVGIPTILLETGGI